ncbi:hypothetical protein EBU71_03610 [bacterium]|nr:hypothetical protein [Candidatus Elulimicrobium humile]
MKSFKNFLVTEGRGKLTASGPIGDEHQKKYIDPHVNSGNFSHTLAAEHDELPKGSSIKIHGVEHIKGKIHVHAEDETGNHHVIPASKLHKPGEAPPNKGHDYESKFVDRMKKHKIMPEHLSGAGSSSGTDFAIENKKKGTFHTASVSGHLLNGETKDGVTAAMGQLTIHHTEERGWHIKDSQREKRPEYAKHIESAGILDYMNKHHSNPEKGETTKSGRAKTIPIKHDNLHPAEAYLKDHHVHVLQVGGYGTYKVGQKDETGHGLPSISGKGQWRIREKQKGNKSARTVAFHPDGVNGLNKSHVNLDDDEHLNQFKKTLGHKQ